MKPHQEVQKTGLSKEVPESTSLSGAQGENRMDDKPEDG